MFCRKRKLPRATDHNTECQIPLNTIHPNTTNYNNTATVMNQETINTQGSDGYLEPQIRPGSAITEASSLYAQPYQFQQAVRDPRGFFKPVAQAAQPHPPVRSDSSMIDPPVRPDSASSEVSSIFPEPYQPSAQNDPHYEEIHS